MRTLLQLSDIHFGMTDDAVIASLEMVCRQINPDVVIISGDLTQRAKVPQFEAARSFIERIKVCTRVVIAVPGNHDIAPYYRPFARVLHPYDRYNKFIRPVVEDRYADDEIAIFGITTSRPSRIKDGRISPEATAQACTWFAEQPSAVKIVVTHHPLALPRGQSSPMLAQGAEEAVNAFEHADVDIYLSGHLHQSSLVQTSERHVRTAHDALAIQAGTVSTRGRGEAQSFNLLRIGKDTVEYLSYLLADPLVGFTPQQARSFVRENSGWKPVS